MSVRGKDETPFSDDSLGESTRSLLSPCFGELETKELDNELSEGTLSLSSDDEYEAERYNGRQETKSWSSEQGNENFVGTSGSYSLISGSNISRSGSTTRTRKQDKDYVATSTTLKTPHNTKSRRTLDYCESETVTSNSCHGVGENKKSELTAWEEWLIKKTIEDRQKQKRVVIQKQKEKDKIAENKRRKEENLKIAEQKSKEWCEEKSRIEREKRRTIMQQKKIDLERKEQTKREIDEKSKQKYGEWLNKKQAAIAERKRLSELNEQEKKEKEIERKMKSEEEYEKWQNQLKSRPRSVYNSFGYTGGKLTGYYEWGSYPAPSYVNPIPWVHPGGKRNKERNRGKKELQPPSPPLLFRDIECRQKQKNK